MIFTASDVESVSKSLGRWEMAEYIFEGLVILACVGELLADLGRKCFKRLQRDRIERYSTILLVAALSLELICLVKTNDLYGMVIGSLSDKATDAEAKAKSAVEKADAAATTAFTADAAAGKAQRKADAVEKQADALTVRVEKASEKLAGLEDKIRIQGPRWKLLEDRKEEFIDMLKPFAGQRILIVDCGGFGRMAPEAEPSRLEEDLLDFLGKDGAGWEEGFLSKGFLRWASWTRCQNGGTMNGGNMVIFSSTAGKRVKDSAEALEKAFNMLKITAVMTQALPEQRQSDLRMFGADSPWEFAARDPTAVILLVGSNPMSDFADGLKERKK